MADYGLKVTKAGKDITSSTPEDYIFNSKYGSVKIVKKDSGTLVVGASTDATKTIDHDQDFAPMTLVYTELSPGSGRWYFGLAIPPSTSADYITTVSTATYVSNANIYLTLTNRTDVQKTVSYYYFALGDTAEY